MIQTGTYNTLKVIRKTYDGLILSDGESDVLLPSQFVTEEIGKEEELFVFVYHNKEGRLVATTDRPYACAGDFAFLKVVSETEKGAFIDIGIDKDVFVPAREQKRPMHKGEKYVVFVYVDDENNRLIASSWIEDFVKTDVPDFEEGDEVSLLIFDRSELGFSAIINNQYAGLLYHNELYEDIQVGDERPGFVKKIRENNKIDLSLRPIGFDFILESKDTLLEILQKNGGVIDLGDKSSPEAIKAELKMSKKAFKQVIGGLYKQRLITISDFQIKLVEKEDET